MQTWLVRLILFALVGVAAPAVAGAPVPPEVDQRTKAITHHLMSPFCPGLLLADCPSGDAQVLREEVAARVAKGESSSSIENDLAARYGDAIRTEPALTGIGLLAWLGPPLAALIGFVVIVRKTRAATAGAAAAQTAGGPAVPLGHAMDDRLQDELDDLD